jgi:DNA-binding NarL/FixJ family response regulator
MMGECESAADAIEFVRGQQPDVVVLDDRLKHSSGLEVLRFLRQAHPAVKVIVFSDYAEPYQRDMYLRAGAHGFFAKAAGLDAVLSAISEIDRDSRSSRAGEDDSGAL